MTDPVTTLPDISSLRARAEGNGMVVCCNHPDIDDQPVDGPDRGCVIDTTTPEDCGLSAMSAGARRIKDKINCSYWHERRRTEPRGASPEDTLALLDRIEALEAENNRLRGQVPPGPPVREVYRTDDHGRPVSKARSTLDGGKSDE